MVLNPQGNLKMKCGIPPIRALQDAGVRIGLGCDNCSCSDAQNMFMAMKLFALLAAASDSDPGPPQAAAALRAATEAGAESARLGHAIGRIAPGCRADLTLDRHERSVLVAAQQRGATARARRGRARRAPRDRRSEPSSVRDRRLTTIDEDEIYDAVRSGNARFPPRLRGHLRTGASACSPGSTRRINASSRRRLDFDRIYIPFYTFP